MADIYDFGGRNTQRESEGLGNFYARLKQLGAAGVSAGGDAFVPDDDFVNALVAQAQAKAPQPAPPPPPSATMPTSTPERAPMPIGDLATWRPPFEIPDAAAAGPVEPAVRPPVQEAPGSDAPTPGGALRGAMNRFPEYTGPMSQDGYTSVPQQADWGAPLTQGQAEQDSRARDLINARSKARLMEIDAAEKARGNAMDLGTEANAREQRYVGSLPANRRSLIAASIDGHQIVNEEEPVYKEGLSVDEMLKQRQAERTARIGAYGKTFGNPQQRSNAELNNRRLSLDDDAQAQETELRQRVKSGRLSPEKAEELIGKIWDRVRERSNVLKSGLYRDEDPYGLNDGSDTPPGNQ